MSSTFQIKNKHPVVLLH